MKIYAWINYKFWEDSFGLVSTGLKVDLNGFGLWNSFKLEWNFGTNSNYI